MGILDLVKATTRLGRRRLAPKRDTVPHPNLIQIGRTNQTQGLIYKATPRNLRYFSRQPYARRAINALKNPIKMLDWEVVPIDGVEWNSELKRQAAIATYCFTHPNDGDDWTSVIEQLVEDWCVGAAALETQIGGDKNRPLWMFLTDGLSIQINPNWDGRGASNHYAQTLGYGSQYGGGQIKHLTDDELLYLRPNRNTATPFGFGPLEIAFNSISRLLGVGEFAGNVAGNQHKSTLLDWPGLNANELMQMREWWRDEIEGQGIMPIVSSNIGGDGKPVALNVHRLYPDGDKALFLEYQEMLVREIAAAFDLSPQNFGIERDVNRNTSEVAEDRDWDQAIKPTANDFAKALTRHCIQNRLGFSQLRFRFVGLEREDELSTMQIMKLRYETNSITPNQIRDRFGEPPDEESPWGDLNYADMEVAMDAARGAKEVMDPRLPQMVEPAPVDPRGAFGAPNKPKRNLIKSRKPKGK